MSAYLRILALAAIALVAPQPASATEPWNGAYLGVNLGWGSASLNGDLKVFNPGGIQYAHGFLSYDVSPSGPFGGIQAGFNVRSGGLFAGIEADLQASDLSSTSRTAFAPPVISAFTYTASASVDWFATVRGRVGFATNDTLVYLTGGFAVAEVDYNATYLITGNNAFAKLKSNETQKGYVLGAGIEQSFGPNWSMKLEYLYINLGEQTVEGALFFANGTPSNETVRSSFDTDVHTVRLGLNYRFWK
jgi:outer membrane immunogenic protein